jgi:branched-chain amino acid aminotransferase
MGVSPKGTKPHWRSPPGTGANISARNRARGCGSTSRRGAGRSLYAPVHSKAAGLYMIASLSKKHADERGYDDALMFDWRGRWPRRPAPTPSSSGRQAVHPDPDCFLNGITARP